MAPLRTPVERPTTGAARPVRVLFINDTARNGGPGRSLASILEFLDPAVVRRVVLLPREGEVAELLRSRGVADELIFEPLLVENLVEPRGRAIERADFDAPAPLRAARAAINAGRALAGLSRLVSRARSGRHDLLYCNGTTACFAGGFAAGRTGLPALWHVRYTAVPPILRGLHRRLSSAAAVRRVLCVSHAAAALFPHCSGKVRVLHNAVNAALFAPGAVAPALRAELGLGREAVVFGSHGRVLPRKGYLEFVEAARLALARLPEEERPKLQVAVVGDTPADMTPDHLAECRARVAALGLGGNVRFLGFRSDVRPYLADFDVAVVPSIYPDPLPRSVIESMAFAVPVIAFDVGGVGEMLTPGTGTLLPAPPSVCTLADALLDYFRDDGKRRREGAAARAQIEAHFDARAHAREVQAEILSAAR
ncbi:MAG TPA: glycosyltransferase family 4 protein [Candidatus Methanoperedens sp.]|nr:glycosyltransferase family 4 protein [Candidatus Methanoperedens sp.]